MLCNIKEIAIVTAEGRLVLDAILSADTILISNFPNPHDMSVEIKVYSIY